MPAALPGVQVVLFDRSSQLCRFHSETYSLVLLLEGASEVTFRGRPIDGAGQIGLLAPDGVFRHKKVPIPETLRMMSMTPEIVQEAARDVGRAPARLRARAHKFHSPLLFRRFARLRTALEEDATPLETQSRFAAVLRSSLEEAFENAPSPARVGREHRAVRRAREMLDARFADKVTLDELAQAARLSAFHLVRAFTRAVGVPPHAYQNLLRTARARALLDRGIPASDAAAEVGFVDQSHMIRQFRKTLGYTPGEYLAAVPRGARG